MYMFLCGHMFSCLLGIYLRVALLGHRVTLFSMLETTYKGKVLLVSSIVIFVVLST